MFNPRQQQWEKHFTWSVDAKKIITTSPVGRVTLSRLDLNDERYSEEDSIRSTRGFWVQAGWHPPNSDPRATS